jgi:hypothetical protein
MRMGLSESNEFPSRDPCCLACVTPKPISVPSQDWKVGDGRFDDLFLMKQLMNLSVIVVHSLVCKITPWGVALLYQHFPSSHVPLGAAAKFVTNQI